MKRILYILAIMASVFCYAEQQADPICIPYPGVPAHYCECRTASQEFRFPLEVMVGGVPMWYSTTINDLKQGLSAYWISDDTITFEVYAFCASETPTLTMSVGPNQMHEMSIEEINQRLEAAGSQADLLGILQPRIRVYTEHGRNGKVYCFPYNEGPKSTCDTFLHVFPRMTYVCDRPEEVYVLSPAQISSQGTGFIQWKQKRNLPATIRMTKDSCNGPELASMTLSDSMRVRILDTEMMKAVRNAGDSIFVHVSHDSSYVGRMIYRNTIKWDSQVIDTAICQGKVLQLGDTVLSESTEYGGDSLWKAGDSIALTGYRLTIVPPEPQYDTIRLKNAQLPYNYRNQIIPQNGWGDYQFTTHQADRCDELYMLHVAHNFVVENIEIDTTVCAGKILTISDVTYTTDTIISDSVWIYPKTGADVWSVRDITIHFSDPEPEYDTIQVAPSKMTGRGYYYSALNALVQYGDTMIVKKANNTCTRWIYLTVEEGPEAGSETGIEDAPYNTEASKYLRNGVLYIRRGETEYDLLGRPTN